MHPVRTKILFRNGIISVSFPSLYRLHINCSHSSSCNIISVNYFAFPKRSHPSICNVIISFNDFAFPKGSLSSSSYKNAWKMIGRRTSLPTCAAKGTQRHSESTRVRETPGGQGGNQAKYLAWFMSFFVWGQYECVNIHIYIFFYISILRNTRWEMSLIFSVGEVSSMIIQYLFFWGEG